VLHPLVSLLLEIFVQE
jgi:hypothetical protein